MVWAQCTGSPQVLTWWPRCLERTSYQLARTVAWFIEGHAVCYQVCGNAYERSLAISCRSMASCPVSRLLSVHITCMCWTGIALPAKGYRNFLSQMFAIGPSWVWPVCTGLRFDSLRSFLVSLEFYNNTLCAVASGLLEKFGYTKYCRPSHTKILM